MTDIVTYPAVISSAGDTLVGRIHRNTDDPTVRQPGIVITGSWLTVKEQMADHYAARLAARGYTTLTFDFAGWGESTGTPRYLESPARKIADIRAVTEYAAGLSLLVPGQLGYLGICASAQYGLAAAATGAPIASYASVAGWFHDTASVALFYGGIDGVRHRLERGQAALDRFITNDEVVTVPAYGPGDERAGMPLELDYYARADRGAIPEWPNRMAEMSWLPWLTFDGIARAGKVSTPVLLVHSDGCVFPDNIERIRRELAAAVTVEWADGDQIDFYDQPTQVEAAVDAATAHFGATLTRSDRSPVAT